MGKKNIQKQKKQLTDLEVDEVSLVDKPAIGETIYLTKSVKGDNSMAKKKSQQKSKASKADTVEDSVVDENLDAADEVEEEVEDAENVDDVVDDDVVDEDDVDEDVVDEDEEGSVNKATELLIKSTVKEMVKAEVKKSLTDVEEMLTQSLQLHEGVGLALNQIVALNMGALDMVMVLVTEDDEDSEVNEEQQSLVEDIRESIKSVQDQVSKSGAKMSRTRLTALRDIASKLTELITSVDNQEAEEKKGLKKGLAKSLSMVTDMSERLEKAEELIEVSSKKLSSRTKKLDERLKAIENTADASNAIDDDDEDDDVGEEEKSKSVFGGLFPTSDIIKRHQKRSGVE